MSRASITNVASLRPEIEFEIIKLTVLREKYIQRLIQTLESIPDNAEIDIGVVGQVDVLREVSIEIVEAIVMWERAQVCLLSIYLLCSC